ncbi:hypothetical protein Z043_112086 [Scleropages formosus]|uniref:Ig-like domain-containing protein n=1 Tax=Scleropages formosus TaxID=113540 RepID=A0A0P7YMV3_SCLFO|nr:hypothetical protein Z043_112086 [Scleropages formosus]
MNLSKDIVVNEGSNVTLMCLASGKPEPSITWKLLSPGVNSFASEDDYLEIPSISRHKAGTYECTAVNEVSADVQTVEIVVNYPPSVSESRDVGASVGQQAVLHCEAEAEPPADFEWYKDDKRIFNSFDGIEIDNTGRLSMLTFFNVSEVDYGNYTCIATNKLGSANTSTVLYEVIEPTSSTLLQERYDGSPEQCHGFLKQCELVFGCFPHLYQTEPAKIAFLLALLTSPASIWAMASWRKHLEISYTEFRSKFEVVFGPPSPTCTAGDRLLH